jgi:hypothetical protein
MSIQYTYTIESVDTEARCMVVVYSADGHTTQHIGARIPFDGESLGDVIAAYAPVAYWEAQKRPLAVPVVGATGTVSPPAAESESVYQEPVFVLKAEDV